jgi:hypothetical protein
VAISLLLPVVSTIHPLALERAMSRTPRMRDWRFSSVSPAGSSPSSGERLAAKARCSGSMGRVTMSIPRLAANA